MMKRSDVFHAIKIARSESAVCTDTVYDAVLTERTILFFQELLVKISHPSYFLHPEFLPGILVGREGYDAQFGDESSISLVEMLDAIEPSLSRTAHKRDAWALACAGLSPVTESYQFHVGFVVGWCTAMIDCGAAPVLPDVVHRCLAPVLVHLIQSISEVLG